MDHRSILKYEGYSPVDFKKRPKPVIITEYVANGFLRDIISHEQQNPGKTILTSTRKLIILYGIASSMLYLHSQKIIHRDLKPENVFIDDFYFLKIADFELSKNISNSCNQKRIGTIKKVIFFYKKGQIPNLYS